MQIKYWKVAWGYEDYIVDCFSGEIYSLKRDKLNKLSQTLRKDGYLEARLYKNKKQNKWLTHRLIYCSYYKCDIGKGLTIDHIDSNKIRNCIANLQLLTRAQNTRKANLGNTYWLGKKHTEKTKTKIAESSKKRVFNSSRDSNGKFTKKALA